MESPAAGVDVWQIAADESLQHHALLEDALGESGGREFLCQKRRLKVDVSPLVDVFRLEGAFHCCGRGAQFALVFAAAFILAFDKSDLGKKPWGGGIGVSKAGLG